MLNPNCGFFLFFCFLALLPHLNCPKPRYKEAPAKPKTVSSFDYFCWRRCLQNFLCDSLFYADTSKYLITSQKLKVIFFSIQIVDSILCDSVLLNPWAYICFSFRDPFKTFWVQFKFNGSSTMSSLQRSTIEVQVPFMLLTLVSKTQTFLPPKFVFCCCDYYCYLISENCCVLIWCCILCL